MQVQVHADEWATPPALPVRHASQPATAVITGAAGEIGGATARTLSKQGWRLLLQYRQADERQRHLADYLSRAHAEAEFIAADLATENGRDALATAVSRRDDVALIVHAASPAITAPVQELVSVNFSALKQLIDAGLPGMLARQKAAVALISSVATERALPGWEAYAGAKSMAASLVDSVERSYSAYGVRGLNIMPGLVATRFSEAFQGNGPALLPQEVADTVVQAIAEEHAQGNTVIVEPGYRQRGRRGFHVAGAAKPVATATGPAEDDAPATTTIAAHAGSSPAASIVRKVLRLAGTADLADAALGVTPGWDSLKHIELIVEIEAALGIHFRSEEMEAVHRFAELDALCRKKLAQIDGNGSTPR
jgi:short-subunit dehydrogenase/acyl carrier protein